MIEWLFFTLGGLLGWWCGMLMGWYLGDKDARINYDIKWGK